MATYVWDDPRYGMTDSASPSTFLSLSDPIDVQAALPTLCGQYDVPEVVVEGGIEPDAIVGWETYSAAAQR